MLFGMVTFVFMSVILLGLFIWQLTDNKRLADEAQRKASALKSVGNPSSWYRDEASNRGSTAVAVMNDDLEGLATLVAGKKDALLAAIKPESDRLLKEIDEASPGVISPTDTLLTAIRKLHRGHQRTSRRADKLQEELDEVRADNKGLSDGVRAARDQFESQIAEMRTEIERLEADKSDQLAAKDDQLTKAQQGIDASNEELSRLRVESQQQGRETEVVIARLQRQIDDLQAKIRVLRPGGFDADDILTKADGKVLRAIPGSDVVFINLGSRDRIRPGLTFEVFSPFRGRRSETGYRGKASIEISAVSEDTAECRVTRATRGRPIVEGDLLVNIAYERDRMPKFVIRGEFDLDYNGAVDWNGIERVTAIIQDWGGQVVEAVDETTDFLVLGMGPQPPSLDERRYVSTTFRHLAAEKAGALEAFRAEIDRADTFYIPIVTQSQFLFLTGFAGREDITRGVARP